MSFQKFTSLEKDLQFRTVTFGDAEGWCVLSVWEDALKQMEAITNGEVRFDIETKENALKILVNSNKTFIIESPDDNFDDRIIEDLSKMLTDIGVKKQFYLVTMDGVEFAQDPLVSIAYMDRETYEKIAVLGYGCDSEYNWTDEGVFWKGK